MKLILFQANSLLIVQLYKQDRGGFWRPMKFLISEPDTPGLSGYQILQIS